MSNKERYAAFSKRFRDSIICPINKTIFLDPVLAYDGIVYEKQIIESWYVKSSCSPLTGKKISNTELVPCIPLRNLINDFLEIYPKFKAEQYINVLKDHYQYKYDVRRDICNEDFDKLLLYTNFRLNAIRTQIDEILGKAKTYIIKHIIDNILDLEIYDKDDNALIHYVVQHGSLDIIKYLVSKNINLNLPVRNSTEKPIHIVCACRKMDIIKYFINLNIELEPTDKSGSLPIQLFFNNLGVDDNGEYVDTIIEYIEKGIDIECINNSGKKIIHLACEKANYYEKLIFYLLQKENIDLEHPDINGWRPIHYLCKSTNIKLIKEIIDKGVELDCVTNFGEKPIHLLAKPSTITMLLYLNNKGAQVSDITDISTKKPSPFSNRNNDSDRSMSPPPRRHIPSSESDIDDHEPSEDSYY